MSDLVPEHNIEIKQGTDRTFTYTLTNNNDVPNDLTGYTAKLEIRSAPGGICYSTLTSSPAAGLTVNAASGEIVVAWTAAQTALFTFERAKYDCVITSPAGTKTCIVQGDVIVEPGITQ